jgi:hypothetical protein
MRVLTPLAVGLVILAAACSSGDNNAVEGAADQAKETTEAAQAAADQVAADAQSATVDVAEAIRTGEPVTLAGKSGCGHCSFNIGTSCSAAMQTADGQIYILDNVDQKSKLFEDRKSGMNLQIAGVVTEKDGVRHLAVDSYEIIM